MRRNPRNRALEICLQQMQSGDNIEQILGAYPRFSAEFRPILEAARIMQELADSIQVPQGDQSSSRYAYLETAGEIVPKTISVRRSLNLRWVYILLVGGFIVSLLSIQLFRMSQDSLPGDWLYRVKILNERINLYRSGNLKQRLDYEFAMDQARVEEVDTLLRDGHIQMVEFSAALEQMDLDQWRVGHLRVVIPVDTRVVGDIQSGYYVKVIGETRPDGGVYARQVQMREYQLSGELQDNKVGEWIVDGVTVFINAETGIRGTPGVGSKVDILALRSSEGDLYARLVEALLP